MPRLPQMYSLTTVGPWIVPVVTKACKRPCGGPADARIVTDVAVQSPVACRQIVTLIVSLCVP